MSLFPYLSQSGCNIKGHQLLHDLFTIHRHKEQDTTCQELRFHAQLGQRQKMETSGDTTVLYHPGLCGIFEKNAIG